MPGKRRFSPEYLLLLRKAIGERGAFVPLGSAQEARNLRSYLYHFRRELHERNHPLAEAASDLKFIIHPNGLEVQTPTAPGASAIRKAL